MRTSTKGNIEVTKDEVLNSEDTSSNIEWSDIFDEEYINDDMGGDDSGILVSSDIPEVKETPVKSVEKLSGGKTTGLVVMGTVMSLLLSLVVLIVYSSYIRFPKREEINEKDTGVYCLKNWESCLRDYSVDGDSYLGQESVYANGDELKVNFCKKMLSTVSYTPKVQNVKNIYGNDYIDKKTRSTVQEESTVHEDEEVTLSYVDYSAIQIDEQVLKGIMEEQGVTLGCVDYENKLVDVFCSYMTTISSDSIPLKEDNYIPNISKTNSGSYKVENAEDEYIDKLLFSSRELWDLFTRFSEVSAKLCGVELHSTEEWNNWNNLTDEQKNETEEPLKYSYKETLPRDWCGVYYLKNEYEVKDSNGNVVKKGISANVGDGTSSNPAGLDTSILTSVFLTETGEDGNEVVNEYPIKVTLRDYKVSQDAITWFESKDERNRGIDVNSEVQYCCYSIEVTNLSNKELTINDNSSLCDSNGNLYSRSGDLFGLTSSVTLQPDESGVIESWNKSTELNRKYLIWGADFSKKVEPVWFRVLAGDIDDSSEDKGVKLNKSRSGESDDSNMDVSE